MTIPGSPRPAAIPADWLVGVPFVNRPDLLELALHSIQEYWPRTMVIDNSPDGMLLHQAAAGDWPVRVARPLGASLTLAQTMSYLFAEAVRLQASIVCFMHNDAEAAAGTPAGLVALVADLQRSGEPWGALFTNYDTLVAFNVEAVRRVGSWDLNLPQYFSDLDYYRRLRLAGFPTLTSGLEVLHHNGASSTLKSDPRRIRLNAATFRLYEQYYTEKWGGGMGEEKYQVPFDNLLFLDEVGGRMEDGSVVDRP